MIYVCVKRFKQWLSNSIHHFFKYITSCYVFQSILQKMLLVLCPYHWQFYCPSLLLTLNGAFLFTSTNTKSWLNQLFFLVLQIRPLPLLQMLFTFGSSLGIGRASEALVGLKNYAFVFVISIYPVVLNVG